MTIATYNVNSIRQRLPLVLDWLAEHKPDVLCLQETKVQDQDFPADEIRNAGYVPSFRGMKGYNGVATLSRLPPDKVIHGLHEGTDNEDFRIIQTVVGRIPIINSYMPQGYSITSEKYAFKLAWFRRLRDYFESALNPAGPLFGLETSTSLPNQSTCTIPAHGSTMSTSTSTLETLTKRLWPGVSSTSFASFIQISSNTLIGTTIETRCSETSAGESITSLQLGRWRRGAARPRWICALVPKGETTS
jgi:hypothetical protein